MFYSRLVSQCDFLDKTYSTKVMGAAALAQGATGRWCEVMWAGPEFLKENNIIPISYDQAVDAAQTSGGEIDF